MTAKPLPPFRTVWRTLAAGSSLALTVLLIVTYLQVWRNPAAPVVVSVDTFGEYWPEVVLLVVVAAGLLALTVREFIVATTPTPSTAPRTSKRDRPGGSGGGA